MILTLTDRDGNPLPDDWYDKKKYPRGFDWKTQRRVARTDVGEFSVSTVWLHGIDHGFGDGPPVIFETMVFGGKWDQEMARYCTEEEAMRGHLSVLDRLREGRPPFSYLDGES